MKYKTALVLAGGAFGTSIGFVLTQNFHKVIIKVRSQEIYDEINRGENTTYLPGQKLPASLKAALTWEEVDQIKAGEIELIISGLPMAAIDNFCQTNHEELKKLLDTGIPLVSLAKGIDHETLKLPDEIFRTHFEDYRKQLMYLSGPSFAKEILDKQIIISYIKSGQTKEATKKAIDEFLMIARTTALASDSKIT